MSDIEHPDYYTEAPTAQDVIDALRFIVMAQSDPAEIAKAVQTLLEYAPEIENSRGLDWIIHLISESQLKVSVV